MNIYRTPPPKTAPKPSTPSIGPVLVPPLPFTPEGFTKKSWAQQSRELNEKLRRAYAEQSLSYLVSPKDGVPSVELPSDDSEEEEEV